MTVAAGLARALGGRIQDLRRVRANRVCLRIAPGDNVAVAEAMIEDFGARLATISAVDHRDTVELNYHFAFDRDHCVATVKTLVPKPDPHIESITGKTAGAQWIEREIADLFGCRFDHPPQLERLIVADDWPADRHPLRRGGT